MLSPRSNFCENLQNLKTIKEFADFDVAKSKEVCQKMLDESYMKKDYMSSECLFLLEEIRKFYGTNCLSCYKHSKMSDIAFNRKLQIICTKDKNSLRIFKANADYKLLRVLPCGGKHCAIDLVFVIFEMCVLKVVLEMCVCVCVEGCAFKVCVLKLCLKCVN